MLPRCKCRRLRQVTNIMLEVSANYFWQDRLTPLPTIIHFVKKWNFSIIYSYIYHVKGNTFYVYIISLPTLFQRTNRVFRQVFSSMVRLIPYPWQSWIILAKILVVYVNAFIWKVNYILPGRLYSNDWKPHNKSGGQKWF